MSGLQITHPTKPTKDSKIDDNAYMVEHNVDGKLPYDDLDIGSGIPVADIAGLSAGQLPSGTTKMRFLIDHKYVSVSGLIDWVVEWGNPSVTSDPVTGLNCLKLYGAPGQYRGRVGKVKYGDVGTWEISARNEAGTSHFEYCFLATTPVADYRTDATGYCIDFRPDTSTINISKFVGANTWVSLLSHSISNLTANHVYKVTRDVSGNFELFVDNVSVGTVTDTTWTTFVSQTIEKNDDASSSNVYVNWIKYNGTKMIDWNSQDAPIQTYSFNNIDPVNIDEYELDFEIFVDNITTGENKAFIILNSINTGYNSQTVRSWNTLSDALSYTDRFSLIHHGSVGSSVKQIGRAVLKTKTSHYKTMTGTILSKGTTETIAGTFQAILNDNTTSITAITINNDSFFYGEFYLYKVINVVIP